MIHPMRLIDWRGLALVNPDDAAIWLADQTSAAPAERAGPLPTDALNRKIGRWLPAASMGIERATWGRLTSNSDPRPPWEGHDGEIPGNLTKRQTRCFDWIDKLEIKAFKCAWPIIGFEYRDNKTDTNMIIGPTLYSGHSGQALLLETTFEIETATIAKSSWAPIEPVVPLMLALEDPSALWTLCAMPAPRWALLEAPPAFLLQAMAIEAKRALG